MAEVVDRHTRAAMSAPTIAPSQAATNAFITTNEQAVEAIQKMDAEFLELTGHQAYLYPSAPTGTDTWRFVFADQTVPSFRKAVEHMAELLVAARSRDDSRLWWCFA